MVSMTKVGISMTDDGDFGRLKEYPPEPGSAFKANPLLWDFVHEDTWWRGEPDCGNVLVFARSMISSEFLQTHPIECRAVNEVLPVPGMHIGTLKHGPGQQRSLAACVALIAYVNAVESNPDLSHDDCTHPLVMKSVSSLMAIPTVMYTSRGSDLIDRMVMVAQQNKDGKVEPVSSWNWYMLLKASAAQLSKQWTVTMICHR